MVPYLFPFDNTVCLKVFEVLAAYISIRLFGLLDFWRNGKLTAA